MTEHEQTIQKLLAENALLKQSVLGWAKAVDEAAFNQHGEIFTDSLESAQEELATLTPETDKLLEDVRKEGVSRYAEHLKEMGQHGMAAQVLDYLNPPVKVRKPKR